MDLAQGHIVSIDALDKDETFAQPQQKEGAGFGGSGGKFKAYNLGKGKGMSVFECVRDVFV
jgi:UDP-glucose 4-epimerase